MTALRIGELFAGYGGLGGGVQSVLGGEIAWLSEIDPGACKILAHRFPDVPNHGDITRIDWAAVEPVDVLTGGFPCQDVSAAGKRADIRPDTRSGLWSQFAYAIDQLRPRLVVVENVRGLLSADAHHPAHGDLEPCPWRVGDGPSRPLRALGAVLGELADLGYDASWQGVRASDVGAPHGRFRVFVVAWPAAVNTGHTARGAEHGRQPQVAPIWTWQSGDVAAQDANLAACGERGLAAPGQAEGGRARADAGGRGGAPAADASRVRSERRRGHGVLASASGASEGDQGQRQRDGDAADDRGAVAAHPDSDGLEGLQAVDSAEPSSGRGHADRLGVEARGVDWGAYWDAIRRWERCMMRPAPSPTARGKNGQPRLSPAFVEWMMGLPAGWVTDVPGLTRNEQLKALGNGVVPQQAAHALRLLLPDVASVAA